MTINAGVWIDHHKAVVVRLTENGEDVRQFLSDRETPARSNGGGRVKNSYTPNDFVAEDRREHKAMNHQNKYYDEVIASLHDADAIVVLGPGEAKGEFTKRIESKKLKGHIAHVAAADKMTDREIAAHVRQLLGIGPQPAGSIDTRIM